jgi:hypothetical protein
MTARSHHLRFVALCGGLLFALAVVAWAEEEAREQLGRALAVAPLAFAGTFFLNRYMRGRGNHRQDTEQRESAPSEAEARVSNLMYLGALGLGVLCVGVAVLAPAHLATVLWVVPVLAGAAGIHLQAVT